MKNTKINNVKWKIKYTICITKCNKIYIRTQEYVYYRYFVIKKCTDRAKRQKMRWKTKKAPGKTKKKQKKNFSSLSLLYVRTSSWESIIKEIICEPMSLDCKGAFWTNKFRTLDPVETTSLNSLKSHKDFNKKVSNVRVLFIYSCTVFTGHGKVGDNAWRKKRMKNKWKMKIKWKMK